jgi:hypothetical protein
MIRHKTEVWNGQHEAVVDEAVWERVQAKLQAASARPRGQMGPAHQQSPNSLAPLMGKLRDETGDRLTPTHTRRHGRQIRYYVSNRLISGGTDPKGWRLPAPALEQAVANVIAEHIGNLARNHRICTEPDLQRGDAVQAKVHGLASTLSEGASNLVGRIVAEGRIEKHHIVLLLQAAALAEALDIQPDEIDPTALRIEAPFALRRRGVEGRIVVGDREPEPDRTLLRALSRAHAWVADLRTGKPLSGIAAATTHSDPYIRTRAQLAFLSPAIQHAILDGRQPPDLTLERIVRKPIPLDWDMQAKLYGFDRGSGHP